MVKLPHLIPTLEAEGYTLLMPNRNEDVYQVVRNSDDEPIGKIRVNLKCVKAYTGTEIKYVPYDLDIETIERFESLNIDLFKRIILATATIS